MPALATNADERAKQFAVEFGGGDFGRCKMAAITDSRITATANRVLDLLGCVCWAQPRPLAYDRMADAVSLSVRQVMYDVKLLESLGYITVQRFRNRPNIYSVPGITGVRLSADSGQSRKPAAAPPRKNTLGLRDCPGCHKRRRLTKTGQCRKCNAKVENQVFIRREVHLKVRQEVAAVTKISPQSSSFAEVPEEQTT